jgi:hypothetical protein
MESAPNPFSKTWLTLIFVCALPVFILFAHLDNPARGRAALLSIVVMATAIRAFWRLRRFAWFWLTAALISVAHVMVVFSIQWTNRSYPGPILAPVLIADYFAVYWFIRGVEWAMGGRSEIV